MCLKEIYKEKQTNAISFLCAFDFPVAQAVPETGVRRKMAKRAAEWMQLGKFAPLCVGPKL